jgi:hypothetical protein
VKERSYDQYTVSFGRQGYGKDKTGIRVGAAEFRCISIIMRHRRIYIRRGGLFYVKATKGLYIFYMVFTCIKIIIQTHLWMMIMIRGIYGFGSLRYAETGAWKGENTAFLKHERNNNAE